MVTRFRPAFTVHLWTRSLHSRSANRWHNEVILTDPSEIDAELLTWIREGYAHTA